MKQNLRRKNLDLQTEERMKKQRIVWVILSIAALIFLGVLVKMLGDFQKGIEEKKRTEYEASEAYGGDQAIAEGERERAEYPIIAELPVVNALFKIGYQFAERGEKLLIRVEATNTYMNQAVEKLKSIQANVSSKDKVKDLAEYDIVFSGFDNYLAEPAASEKTNPVEYLVEAYANAKAECAIFDGRTEGDYYYTKVTTGNASHYDLMTYRVILKKDGETWKFVGTPVPIVTIYNMVNVPEEILNKANNY